MCMRCVLILIIPQAEFIKHKIYFLSLCFHRLCVCVCVRISFGCWLLGFRSWRVFHWKCVSCRVSAEGVKESEFCVWYVCMLCPSFLLLVVILWERGFNPKLSLSHSLGRAHLWHETGAKPSQSNRKFIYMYVMCLCVHNGSSHHDDDEADADYYTTTARTRTTTTITLTIQSTRSHSSIKNIERRRRRYGNRTSNRIIIFSQGRRMCVLTLCGYKSECAEQKKQKNKKTHHEDENDEEKKANSKTERKRRRTKNERFCYNFAMSRALSLAIKTHGTYSKCERAMWEYENARAFVWGFRFRFVDLLGLG